MEYYLQAFEYWNNEKLEKEASEDKKITEEIINSIGITDEEISALECERNELQIKIENEEHNQLFDHYTKINKLCYSREAEIHKLQEAISQKICFQNEAPNRLAQMQKTIEVNKAINTKCKIKTDNLLKVLEEAKNNNSVELFQESEQAISQCSTQLKTCEQMANDSEKKLARLHRKAEQLQTNVNKGAMECLPVLQGITQHGNFPITEQDLQEIKEKQKNWKTELKSQISRLENVLEEMEESIKAKEYRQRESIELKGLEAELQDAEAEGLQMKCLKEQEEDSLKLELQDIIQGKNTLAKDTILPEKAQNILHQKEAEVQQAKLHIEQVHQKSQEIIDKRIELFTDFMKKVTDKLKAAKLM